MRRAIEANQLRGAAADVEQDHSVGIRIDERRAAGRGKGRFGLPVDDFEIQPHLLGNARTELDAVFRRAARFRRDQAGAGHPAAAHLVSADRKRLHGTLDRSFADAARARNALPQANDAGERIYDAKAVSGRSRYQKPAVVGAEIQRGIGRPCMVRRAPTWPTAAAVIEAAGCPALVRHRTSFLPRRSLMRLDGSGMSKFTIESNVSRRTRA